MFIFVARLRSTIVLMPVASLLIRWISNKASTSLTIYLLIFEHFHDWLTESSRYFYKWPHFCTLSVLWSIVYIFTTEYFDTVSTIQSHLSIFESFSIFFLSTKFERLWCWCLGVLYSKKQLFTEKTYFRNSVPLDAYNNWCTWCSSFFNSLSIDIHLIFVQHGFRLSCLWSFVNSIRIWLRILFIFPCQQDEAF